LGLGGNLWRPEAAIAQPGTNTKPTLDELPTSISISLAALLLPRVFQPVRSFYQLTLAERYALFYSHSSIFRVLIPQI
jgi:hypothetical protein